VTFAGIAKQFEKEKLFQEVTSFIHVQIHILLIQKSLKTNLVYFPAVPASISYNSSKQHMNWCFISAGLESLLIRNQ